MVCELTDRMAELFEAQDVFSLATASKDGEPNVIPVKAVKLKNRSTVWITDNYLNKTLTNMQKNPRASFYLIGGEGNHESYQIKGNVRVETSGSDYEKDRKNMKAKKASYPAKGLVVFTVTDMFRATPGNGAGDRI